MPDYITRGEVRQFMSLVSEESTLQDVLAAAAKVWPDRTYNDILFELEAAYPPRTKDE